LTECARRRTVSVGAQLEHETVNRPTGNAFRRDFTRVLPFGGARLLFAVRCKGVLTACAFRFFIDRMSSPRIGFGLFFTD